MLKIRQLKQDEAIQSIFFKIIELSYKQQKKQYWKIFEYLGINQQFNKLTVEKIARKIRKYFELNDNKN